MAGTVAAFPRASPPARAFVTIPAVLLGVALGLGKIVRDCSLTCNVGFRLAPLGILAVALATAPVAALRARLEARWGYRRWHAASTLFAAASFLLFRLLTYYLQWSLSEAPASEAAAWLKALRWTYLAFFDWLGTVSVVLVANAFGHVHSSLRAGEREKAVGYVAAAALAGGLAGSWLAGRSASWLLAHGWRYEAVRDNLMLAMAVALLLKASALPLIRPREHAEPPAPAGRARPDLPRALAWIRSDPYLRGLTVLVLVTGVADTMMKYLFYWFVSEQTSASGGRTLYFAGFYVWLNAASLFMMAFGTERVIRRHGLRLALLSLPVALVFGAASLAVSLALIVMYGLRVVEGAFRSALYEPGLERLYLRIPDDRFGVLRPVLSGLTGRAGEGLGAVLVMSLALALAPSLRTMVGFYLLVLLAWAGVVMALWRRVRLGAAPRAAARLSGVME